jgi:hypothetical protein
MMKKGLLLPVAATMIVISIFTGGAVMAQENGTGETPVIESFASRVASILGLDEAQVQDAMDQARREMQDEALKSKLDSMVERGWLIQEQADAYWQWYQSRPEGIRGFGGPGPGFGFGGHSHGMGPSEGRFGPPRDLTPFQDSPGDENTTS